MLAYFSQYKPAIRASLVPQLIQTPPANAGDMSSIPDPGRSRMP